MNFDHLRKLLIQKALEGKLVPQLDSEQKVAQGELTENALQEIPFNIPEKWKWFKLNKFVSVISGTSFKKTDQVSEGNGVRVIRGGNLRDFKIETKNDDVFVDNSLHDSDKEIQSSDIVIVASTGSKEVIGRAACYRGNEKIQIGAFLRIIRPNKKEYAPYLKILFQSDYYRKHIRNCSKGTNINNIKKEYITELSIPIPPVQEQRRIVAKLEEAFAEIDRAEKAYEELQTLAGVLRGQILQEAIQGKLVPQLAAEGVVEQIGAAPEEVPFEIPESWKWVQLKSIGQIIGGGTPKTSVADYWNGDISWITPADLGKNTSKWILKGSKEALQKPSLILRLENFHLLHRLNYCTNDCSGYF
jgi:type I restriction-modification system